MLVSNLFSAKPLSETMMSFCELDPSEWISVKFELKYNNINTKKRIWKCRLKNCDNFVFQSQLVKDFAFNAQYEDGESLLCFMLATDTSWQALAMRMISLEMYVSVAAE